MLAGNANANANASPIAPEAVVTFDRLDGFDVLQSLGDVRGEAVVARNFFRATFRTIGSLIGISAAECLTDAERGRAVALAALLHNAKSLGANGIVKLRFDAGEQSDGSTRVTAYGAAVLLDPAPGFAATVRR